MKSVLCCVFLLCVGSWAKAQQKNEEALVNKILVCFANHDDSAYASLFPKYDSLYQMAIAYKGGDVVAERRINNIRSNPARLQQFDPSYNQQIIKDFDSLHRKGVDSGIHWSDLLLARYELEKSILPRELVGFEKIVPIRLQGHIFFQDLLTRRMFCMAIKDVHSYNGRWYGGRVVNVLEAESIDEYYEKLAKERKIMKDVLLAQLYGQSDTAGAAEDSAAIAAKAKAANAVKKNMEDEDEEEKKVVTGDVVERKLYTGTFDKEVGLELYIRGLKGNCPQVICGWEAIYKFEDKDEYVRLEVTKGADGKLLFSEEDGEMELSFKNGKATGEWTSSREKTTFEIQLTEKKEVKNRKLFQLDAMLEEGE